MRQPETVFWSEESASGTGGYFLRCETGPFIQRLNDAGRKVVGIRFDPERPRNLEFITVEVSHEAD